MELLLLVSSIFFWVIFYIFQGLHDTNFIKEVEELQNELSDSDKIRLKDATVAKEIKWKFWGSLEKALTKLFITVLIYFLTSDLLFSFLLAILSIFIRWFVHDLTVAIGLRRGINHIGPDYVWSDKILRDLSKMGINQYVVKITPFVLILGLIIFYITN